MSSNAAATSASKASASPAEATQRPRNKANSSLDRSSSMALAFFNRRHSSTLGLRRSVSSVSSRRHSSPISQNSEDGSETGGAGAKKIPRSLRWRLLANKVLGNVDEEDSSTHGRKSLNYMVSQKVLDLAKKKSFKITNDEKYVKVCLHYL